MTLIVALQCKDGVIIAADSATTDPECGTKQPSDKISKIVGQSILYGCSGDVGLKQKIEDSLRGFQAKVDVKTIRQKLKERIVPDQRSAIDWHARYPTPNHSLPPSADLLFVGVFSGKPWIVGIERNGADTQFDMRLGGFAAIGSGTPWAQAIFRPHLFSERDLDTGRVMLYRVVADSIAIASGGLSLPVRMQFITLEGEVHCLSDEEMAPIGDCCEYWKQIEREAVGKALSARESASGGEEPTPLLPQAGE